MIRIAIVGPGAIGGTIAAWLAQESDHEITLCARSVLDMLRIETPRGIVTARPEVLVDPATATPADWIIVTTKTYDAAGAARWIRPMLHATTRVAILQNGVEHLDRFAGLVPRAAMVPAVVDIPAERTAPGRVIQRREGTITVPDDDAGRAFAALLARTPIAVTTSDRFLTAAWRKLALNSAGAVNALLLKPAAIARDEGIAEVMRGLAAECVVVGRAESADLPDTLPDEVVAAYRAMAPESINSLHADRAAGRPMELDARNGVIVRRGAAHGIATPLNAAVVALLAAAD